MPSYLSITCAALLACTVGINASPVIEARGHRPEFIVKAGGSIQAAINAAHRGDTIIVEKGVYNEQLTIKTHGIRLIGKGATLQPPVKTIQNGCTGLAGDVNPDVGICIIGSGLKFGRFLPSEHRELDHVSKPVEDVEVSGFTLNNFNGLNIAIVGAHNANVHDNKIIGGVRYGILTVGSTGTEVCENKVVSNIGLHFVGICMDDESDVRVDGNSVNGYAIGICVKTDYAEVTNNHIENCCIGAYVNPHIEGAHIAQNNIHNWNKLCYNEFGGNAFGVVLEGAVNSVVEDNIITNIDTGRGPYEPTAGITVWDSLSVVARSEGNLIQSNTLASNAADITSTSKGHNTFRDNNCDDDDSKFCQ